MSLDRFVTEPLPDMPVAANAGSFIVTHPQGIPVISGYRMRADPHPLALVGLSATDFYLMDLVEGTKVKVPNPPAGLAFGAGVSAVWDASRGTNQHGRVYVFGPGVATDAWWHHLDIDTLAWDAGGAPEEATLEGLLGGVWTVDSALSHPCSAVSAAVNDDNGIYLVGKGAVTSYKYDPTEPAGTGWTSIPPANRAVAAGAGCVTKWLWSYSVNRIASLDGGGLGSAEYYRILADGGGAANTWVAGVPIPAFTGDLPGTGTCGCASTDGSALYFKLNQTGRIYSLEPNEFRVMPIAELTGPDGTGAATVGSRMCAFRYRDHEYLVCLVMNSVYVQRIRLS